MERGQSDGLTEARQENCVPAVRTHAALGEGPVVKTVKAAQNDLLAAEEPPRRGSIPLGSR
jgi:hypothetical protein